MSADIVAAGNVPATAFLTALARARATDDPDNLLRDPIAARFAELCPTAIRGVTRHTAGAAVVVARTVLIDRMLAELFARESVDTCVNLGAGFDARPFRMAWPAHCQVIEVDSAPVLDLKDELLPAATAGVPVERLRCDLRDTDRLTALLLPRTAGRLCVILAEGLLTYLPQASVGALASAVAGVGMAADWICDVLSPDSARSLTRASQAAGAPLEMHGHTQLTLFEAAGWRCEQLELLPSARLTKAAAGSRAAASSQLLPDSVLRLRRR
ncbi:class I SAM-dependent methyltransferase [Streptomyces olivochromogenes]|uniref:class I SAM-dependent methyltransferase n=1 Tax=Streptomyces olivochromogenes TaxID=1963 RepID=UPI001F233871|nr:class I SAM-dependent methyltransferase [Streptomyces olivochromogenes]MCF3134685.1 class I SAM-dependent methyltransferase [Streptomyces olivochromogenes]